jgi:hypothetical protein
MDTLDPPSLSEGPRPGHDPAPSTNDFDEFAAIRPTRRFSPVLALAVVMLSLYLAFTLRRSFRFALAPRVPVRVHDLVKALAEGRVGDGSYIQVRAPLERFTAQALLVRTAEAYKRVLRVRNTRASFVMVLPRAPGLESLPSSAPGAAGRASWSSLLAGWDEWYDGRLERVDATPFGQAVREAFAHHRTVRWIPPAELRRARAAGAGDLAAVADVAGEQGPIAADATTLVRVRVPERLDVRMGKDRWPTVEAAREALVRAISPGGSEGAMPSAGPPVVTLAPEASAGSFLFTVVGGEALLAQLRHRFRDRAERVTAEPHVDSHRTMWGGLVAGPDSLTVRLPAVGPGIRGANPGVNPSPPEAALRVPYDRLDAVVVEAPLPLAPGAVLLLSGERPDGLWYIPVVYVGLVLATLASLVALWATRKR